jgi:hypothetical protein
VFSNRSSSQHYIYAEWGEILTEFQRIGKVARGAAGRDARLHGRVFPDGHQMPATTKTKAYHDMKKPLSLEAKGVAGQATG